MYRRLGVPQFKTYAGVGLRLLPGVSLAGLVFVYRLVTGSLVCAGNSAIFDGFPDACVQQKGAPVALSSAASSSDSDSSSDEEPQVKVQKTGVAERDGRTTQKAHRKAPAAAPPSDSSEDTSSDDESNATARGKSPMESSAAAGMSPKRTWAPSVLGLRP